MQHIKRAGLSSMKNNTKRWFTTVMKSPSSLRDYKTVMESLSSEVRSLTAGNRPPKALERPEINNFAERVVLRSGPGCARIPAGDANHMSKVNILGAAGALGLLRPQQSQHYVLSFQSSFATTKISGANTTIPSFARSFASKASESTRENPSKTKKEIITAEDPFDSPTYNIPEKPMTFTEGASYSAIILAGLAVAAAAGYAVFKELIFEPKEYKIYGKALKRIQNDSQVKVRVGSPITGYGQESRNRAARQRVPNKIWTDEDGIEHVEVNFYIRGQHGGGKVFAEMFKDKVDKEWKFTYLIVEIKDPSPTQLILESYLPALKT